MRPLRIGVSSCLLGQKVRYDAGHKYDPSLVEAFGRQVEWVPVCPEVEVGMGVPREPVRLVQLGDTVHMQGVRTGTDWTQRMDRFARRRLRTLSGLSGYVFKKDSPSCGVFRVKGLFAAAFRAAFPLVPVEEEGRLHDPRWRESFVTRVFAYRELQDLLAQRLTRRKLVAFHGEHESLLLGHSPQGYRELGRLIERGKDLPARALAAAYTEGFMKVLARV